METTGVRRTRENESWDYFYINGDYNYSRNWILLINNLTDWTYNATVVPPLAFAGSPTTYLRLL